MKKEEYSLIEKKLQTVSDGTLSIEHAQSCKNAGQSLFTKQLQAITTGKGRMEIYDVHPGIEASFNAFLAPEIRFRHGAFDSVLEIHYCHSGRIGWNMSGGIAVYLGAGDLTVHSMACCADSLMMFPLGYSEGVSVTVELENLPLVCPEILQGAGIDADLLQKKYGSGKPTSIPSCSELEYIFAPLFSAPASVRLPLLKLKVLEVLLYLSNIKSERRELTQYFSRQTELIKEIHQQLTEHLDQRFTIEELSRQYLINTSTLKEVFKGVYGLPIATYMKKYRIRQAMKLLRETNAPIADIAAQVGYETQGKFSKAFKDVAQVVPTEYRKMQHQKNTDFPLPN